MQAFVVSNSEWWRFVDDYLLPAMVLRSLSIGGPVPDSRTLSMTGEVPSTTNTRTIAHTFLPALCVHYGTPCCIVCRLGSRRTWMKWTHGDTKWRLTHRLQIRLEVRDRKIQCFGDRSGDFRLSHIPTDCPPVHLIGDCTGHDAEANAVNITYAHMRSFQHAASHIQRTRFCPQTWLGAA